MKLLWILASICIITGCSQQAAENVAEAEDSSTEPTLGSLQHEFSISDAAQKDFEAGLLLLHRFEYDDAGEAFAKAIEADGDEVMGYWGMAMSYYKALWGLQDVEAGRALMQELGEDKAARLAKCENQLERDFWEGIELLYGEGELNQRNQAYADHMAKLHDQYPTNQEVAAFYALGLMWSVPLGRDAEVFNRSAEVVAGILKENPNHPGALHYMIHAYDDPEYAQLAIEAADLYAQVAPDATHALHMPSHIYLALGMWANVVSSNEASYQASLNRMERKGLDPSHRGYHSYAWLHYGYLQQMRYDDAHKLLKDMASFTSDYPTRQARSYWISMINAYLTEVGTWSEDIDPMIVSRQDLSLVSKAGHRFFQARMAFDQKDQETIKTQIDSLNTEIGQAEMLVTSDGITLCSAGTTRYAPNRIDVQRSTVMLHQMSAMLALLQQNAQSAEKFMKEATSLEAKVGYSFGPPDIPYPSFEQYGFWLLDQGRAKEAMAQFELSLERTPKRSQSLNGLVAALSQLQMDEELTEVKNLLQENRKVNS